VAEEIGHRELIQRAGGATEKRIYEEAEQKVRPTRKFEGPRGGGKGKVIPQYHSRIEEYAYVTQADLREAVSLGVLQQVLIQTGTFFFSGAFWLFIDLIIRQAEGSAPFRPTPWMGVCLLSIVFGVVLAVAGWAIFLMKQEKLRRYFATEDL
jgi:hypothetical protein